MIEVLRHAFSIRAGQPHFALQKSDREWRPVETAGEPVLRQLESNGRVHEFYSGNSESHEHFPWYALPDNVEDGVRAAIQFLPRLNGRRWICAITGCKETSAKFSTEVAEAARFAGQFAAQLGWTVLTGGLSGVMSCAAEGARNAGGETLGILPGEEHQSANPHIQYVLPSGIGYARNYLVASMCDLMISLPGGTGTLEELCFALDFKRAVLSWGGWQIENLRAVPLGDRDQFKQNLIQFTQQKYKEIYEK